MDADQYTELKELLDKELALSRLLHKSSSAIASAELLLLSLRGEISGAAITQSVTQRNDNSLLETTLVQYARDLPKDTPYPRVSRTTHTF